MSGNPNPAPAEQSSAAPESPGGDEALGKLLAEYDTKLNEMRELVLRERAEIDNQRKRMVRDLDQARRFANERVLADLLPVCDGLERGLAIETTDAAGLRAGMELTLRELLRVTEAHGLKPVDPLGQPFDPERHQAMTLIESPDQPAGSVVAVLQKGYTLNDRLLRPALVTVAK